MANRNQEANKFFRGAYKLMTEAAAKGYEDVRPYVKDFSPADAPYLTNQDLADRKRLYLAHLHTVMQSAFLEEDIEFVDRVKAFSKASASRTCKKPINV